MGNCFNKGRILVTKNVITYPNAVDNFVQGGDILFIQELTLVDTYTKLNGQIHHAFLKHLRLKQNIDDPSDIKQWCRMAIVIDSEVPEIKYLLELEKEGFLKREYISRVVEFKAKGQIFAIKRLRVPLSARQSVKLRVISDFLSKDMSPNSGNYARFFELKEGDLTAIDPNYEKKKRKQKEQDDPFTVKSNKDK